MIRQYVIFYSSTFRLHVHITNSISSYKSQNKLQSPMNAFHNNCRLLQFPSDVIWETVLSPPPPPPHPFQSYYCLLDRIRPTTVLTLRHLQQQNLGKSLHSALQSDVLSPALPAGLLHHLHYSAINRRLEKLIKIIDSCTNQ